jgi:hypothetical protein
MATWTLAAVGLMLLASALVATPDWFDAHILPSFYLPRPWFALIYTWVRWSMALGGLALVMLARPISRHVHQSARIRLVPIALAVLLALGAGELALRQAQQHPLGWLVSDDEPPRQSDPRLGWTFVPSRTGRRTTAGRVVDYAIDASGYRVRDVKQPVDFDRPTILFTGESVMFGDGLTWDESVPAQVGAILGVQTANLAVHGYSTDQAYLRLRAELPRFHRPVAVVALFMTTLFGRNLDENRPHLGPGLVWLPAQQHARLVSLAGLLFPFRRLATVDRGIDTTRDVLRATIELSRNQGARALILVPQLGPEQAVERTLRRRILEEGRIPYLPVELDRDWRLPGDLHPTAGAARAIASAVAAQLNE